MQIKSVFLSSASMAALAVVVMVVCTTLQLNGVISNDVSLTFLAFAYWACYFYAGATPKDAVATWLSSIVGILGATGMFVLSGAFARMGLDPNYVALPLAVFLCVVPMSMAQLLPVANRVPAIFVNAATFFAVAGYPAAYEKGFFIMGVGHLLYAAIGLFAGYVSVHLVNLCAPRPKEVAASSAL